MLVNKYYFDHLYTDVIAGGVKGPIARAAYWFNQNVLDGIVNGVAAGVTVRSAGGPTSTSTRVSSTAPSTAPAPLSEALRPGAAPLQTGKVQQYGALLFGGAVVLAGIFVFAI